MSSCPCFLPYLPPPPHLLSPVPHSAPTPWPCCAACSSMCTGSCAWSRLPFPTQPHNPNSCFCVPSVTCIRPGQASFLPYCNRLPYRSVSGLPVSSKSSAPSAWATQPLPGPTLQRSLLPWSKESKEPQGMRSLARAGP